MLKLHDNLASGNGYKVRLLLTQLGVTYKRIEYNIEKGETRTPVFLRMNPNGRVPVLELEDAHQYIAESDAILVYLAEGTKFLPADKFERAQVFQWLFFEQYSHEPNIATLRSWLKNHALDDERAAHVPMKRRQGLAALDVMEVHLIKNEFFVGGKYTIADIALYAYTHVAGEGGFDLGTYPAVKRWLARVVAQPGHITINRS